MIPARLFASLTSSSRQGVTRFELPGPSRSSREIIIKWQPDRLPMVIPARLERATHSLEGCCSIQLSYGTGSRGQKYIFFKCGQEKTSHGIPGLDFHCSCFGGIEDIKEIISLQCQRHWLPIAPVSPGGKDITSLPTPEGWPSNYYSFTCGYSSENLVTMIILSGIPH